MNIKEYLGKPWYKEPFYVVTAIVFLGLAILLARDIYVDSNSYGISFNSEFHGEITQVHNQRSTYYLRLSNAEKWIRLENFHNNSEPRLNTSGWFVEMFYKGDFVHKDKNSSQMRLTRNNEKYTFTLENLNPD